MFYSTRADDTAEQILTRYACRWSIEVMNRDVKGQLGFEQPQGWSRQAVLWFSREGHRHYRPLTRP